ncbi:precorrin-6Y C5,15-methyltransferase (decarboxylating) subunit CbiT [Clostridium hydrogeniformans]|uniref:precorrin-6Y C5,15-methyltransferase (decarboxylating) subunit CbiT n=1 Tax=Clostridium hydrogeniformans TaxID=349933 RepID=UPI000488311E|nr:precorrin-6Y C5,15-methyltransferase (decarboxylating) subunit CbiT [Clostridium hydrogeniformans]
MVFIKDEEFIRGKCPMTKEDIRILSIGKLNLEENSKIIDVGSGTGSITVQCAKLLGEGIVYSLERDEEAFNITKENIEKFNCKNVVPIKGEALEALKNIKEDEKNLSSFASIFIGGSGGDIKEIIEVSSELLKTNGTMVLNFITLNNAYKAIEILKGLNFKIDITLANISKNRGDSYMMISNNPIFILQGIKIEE